MAIELRYWDSACFLGWLKGEQAATCCRGVIEAAKDGRVKIVTSTWTLTEVVHLGANRGFKKEDDEKIRSFFERSYIVLRPVTEQIGHSARELFWNQACSQKDAIHVATALDAKCSVLDTLDDRLVNNGSIRGIRVTRPDLSWTAGLFDEVD